MMAGTPKRNFLMSRLRWLFVVTILSAGFQESASASNPLGPTTCKEAAREATYLVLRKYFGDFNLGKFLIRTKIIETQRQVIVIVHNSFGDDDIKVISIVQRFSSGDCNVLGEPSVFNNGQQINPKREI